MTSAVRNNLLQLIVREWSALSALGRPDRVWILEFAAASGEDGIDPGAPAEQFWVLDENGLNEQCIIQWHRLDAIRGLGPVGARPEKPEKPENDGTRVYETGYANFAPLPEAGQYYLEWTFGPVLGERYKFTMDSDGNVREQTRLQVS